MRRGPIEGMALVAAIVVAIDFESKRYAAATLGAGERVLAEGLRLTIVHNDLLVGGVSLGGATRAINVALIAVLVALMTMVVRDLTAVDPAAPRVLGLLAGAAVGNALDLAGPGAGAVDFIAVAHGPGAEIAFNLADIAFVIGLVLCARTVVRVLLAWRIQRAIAADPAIVGTIGPRRAFDVEVPRNVIVDGLRPRRAPAERRRPASGVTIGDPPPAPPEARP